MSEGGTETVFWVAIEPIFNPVPALTRSRCIIVCDECDDRKIKMMVLGFLFPLRLLVKFQNASTFVNQNSGILTFHSS